MKEGKSSCAGSYGAAGTPSYMAPEVLDSQPYNSKADVFGVAVIACEMLNGQYPWHGISEKSSISFEDAIIHGVRPPIPKEHSAFPGLASLIERGWHANPEIRPTSDEMLKEVQRISESLNNEEEDIMKSLGVNARSIIVRDRYVSMFSSSLCFFSSSVFFFSIFRS